MKTIVQKVTVIFILMTLPSCKPGKEGGPTVKQDPEGTGSERSGSGRAHPMTIDEVLSRQTKGNMDSPEREATRNKIALLSSDDLRNLLDQLGKKREAPENRDIFSLAIAEYAKRAPESVMSLFVPEEMKQGAAGFADVCGELTRSRPDVLQAWLLNDMKRADKSIQRLCLDIALGTWSQSDPGSAFSFAMSHPWNTSNNAIINDIFGHFGELNPAEADRAAAAAFTGRDLEDARHNIALAAGETNPDIGLEYAAKITDRSQRGQTIAGILTGLMDSDRAAAIAKLKALDPLDLETTLQSAAGTFLSIVRKFGSEDSDLLMSLMGNMVPTASNEAVFTDAINSLSNKHPEKSMKLIESLPDSDLKRNLFGDHYRSLAEADSSKALETASGVSDPKLRAEAYAKIGEVIGANGWDAASKTLGSLNQDDKKAFLDSAIPYLMEADPQKISNLISAGQIELTPDKRREVFTSLGQRFNASDSASTRSWLEKLQPGDQPDAMKGIATDMAKKNINELASMLGSIPQDKAWQEGVKILIDNVRGSDPEMADKWKNALDHAGGK